MAKALGYKIEALKKEFYTTIKLLRLRELKILLALEKKLNIQTRARKKNNA